jgi:hypothetical protein
MADKDTIDELQPMTLATIAGGELESQFQERLHQVLEFLRDFRRLQPDSDGTYRIKIEMEVAIQFDPSDGSYSHWARALHPKKPKPIAAERDAYRRGDDLKVLPEMVQGDLPTS